MASQFGRYRFPASAGGGDLVMRILTAEQVDRILEVEGQKSVDVAAELTVESIYSIDGERWPEGTRGLQALAKLPTRKRAFVLDAYAALHNTTAAEDEALKKSMVVSGTADGDVIYRFKIPASIVKPLVGVDNEVTLHTFDLRELRAGQVDDIIRAATRGVSRIRTTNRLIMASLVSFPHNGPSDAGDVAWLGAQTNRIRTMIAEAYNMVHTPDKEDEVDPFLAGAEILDEPPKVV